MSSNGGLDKQSPKQTSVATVSLTVVREQDYFLAAFSKMYAHEFYEAHKAEIKSTSPYAVTDKTPTLRVVDNVLTSGEGYTSSISSTDHYGFFGGYKGSSVSGGGGSWSLDSKVQFDHINLCPVTGREFTDEELKKYHDDWLYQCRSYGKNEARRTRLSDDPATLKVVVRWQRGTAHISYEDVERLCMVNLSGEEIKELIESATKGNDLLTESLHNQTEATPRRK